MLLTAIIVSAILIIVGVYTFIKIKSASKKKKEDGSPPDDIYPLF